MRIAYISMTVKAGSPAGSTLVNLIRARVERGDEVTVFANELDESLLDQVRFIRVPMVQGLGIPGALLSFHVAHLLQYAFLRWLRRERFEVIYSLDSESLLASHVTFHNCCAECLAIVSERDLWSPSMLVNISLYVNLQLRMVVERINCRKATRVYALTERHKQFLVNRYGCDAAKVAVTPNYIQKQILEQAPRLAELRQETRRELGLDAGEFAVIFVALGAWPRKGLKLLLEAFALLLPRGDAKLLVVGAGSHYEMPWFQRYSRDLALGDRVLWLGPKSNVFPYYAAADCLVVPSYYELFSLVPLEALAAGLPILMTDVSGVDEVLKPNENGFLLKLHPADIADKIEMLMRNRQLCRAFAAASLRLATKWGYDTRVGELTREYATF